MLFSGPDATNQRQTQAYQVLNSLRFDGFTSGHPRPRATPLGPPHVGPAGGVAVLNATGRPGAASVTANLLRGLGYTIVATGEALSARTGTTVACRSRLARQAAALAKVLGPSARVVAFPNPAPLSFSTADCIVSVGN